MLINRNLPRKWSENGVHFEMNEQNQKLDDFQVLHLLRKQRKTKLGDVYDSSTGGRIEYFFFYSTYLTS